MDIEEPKVGQVIRYSFLWHKNYLAGQEEGNKDRPAVIVVALEMQNGKHRVAVLPITHSATIDPTAALEIPPKVKAYLKLDSERSWIVLDELNEFNWPGYDLRPVPGTRSFTYGMIPPKLLSQITGRMKELGQQRRAKQTPRDN